MGKGIFSILILILTCFFSGDVQSRTLSGKENEQVLAVKDYPDVLTAATGTRPSAIEQNTVRVLPASRCGHVLKDFGSGNNISISLAAAGYPQTLPGCVAFLVARCSYLSHIYPSHNFW